MSIRTLISLAGGQHPAGDILQAHADSELRGMTLRLTRAHLRHCERCAEEVRSSTQILDLFVLSNVPAAQFVEVKARIIDSIRSASEFPSDVFADVRRILGPRVARELMNGQASPALQRELAGFLGSRAALSLLTRNSDGCSRA